MLEHKPEKVYTVTEINRQVRGLIENEFATVWVEGEIANYLRHTSGHLYFSLRDETAQLRAVMFRRQNQFLRFEPENGLKVLARGRLSLYERGGQYQIIVDLLQPSGIGPLELAFQQIRQKLESEGLFEARHKKPLPAFPVRIGVVTSPTGAAIRDIVHVVGRRAPWIEMILRPTLVQGEGAAEDIARAVDEFNEYGHVDVLIVGRGGGSTEDLWAFNEEIVARSLFRSIIPVVSAVGHEIDYTISDLVADLRAPTPSAAAEMVVPESRDVQKDVVRLVARQRSSMENRLERASLTLRTLMERSRSLRLDTSVGQHLQRVDELLARLSRAMIHVLDLRKRELGGVASRLNGVSPLAVLARGYCLCRTLPEMDLVTQARVLAPSDEILVRFHEGEAVCSVEEVRTQPED